MSCYRVLPAVLVLILSSFPDGREQRRPIPDPFLLSPPVNIHPIPLLDSLLGIILVYMSNAATAVNDPVHHVSH